VSLCLIYKGAVQDRRITRTH